VAIPTRDLMKVKDNPEVRAAMEARDQAVAASREAYSAWRDADRVADERAAELEAVATRALEAWRKEV
jgi:hypothetical protein